MEECHRLSEHVSSHSTVLSQGTAAVIASGRAPKEDKCMALLPKEYSTWQRLKDHHSQKCYLGTALVGFLQIILSLFHPVNSKFTPPLWQSTREGGERGEKRDLSQLQKFCILWALHSYIIERAVYLDYKKVDFFFLLLDPSREGYCHMIALGEVCKLGQFTEKQSKLLLTASGPEPRSLRGSDNGRTQKK